MVTNKKSVSGRKNDSKRVAKLLHHSNAFGTTAKLFAKQPRIYDENVNGLYYLQQQITATSKK